MPEFTPAIKLHELILSCLNHKGFCLLQSVGIHTVTAGGDGGLSKGKGISGFLGSFKELSVLRKGRSLSEMANTQHAD